MTPTTPDQQPRTGARQAGPVAYTLTGWPVLAVLLGPPAWFPDQKQR